MSINISKIPIIPKNQTYAFGRKFLKQMASGGFMPVILLEAFVEGGRTYQAYKRGGFDEARERITEEFSGAVFWMGGVKGLNWLFEKLGQKILKLPNKIVDTASDGVRNPIANYLMGEKTINGKSISKSMLSKFKFAKIAASVLIANGFIGFALPKINQAITRSYHKKDAQKPVENAVKFTPAVSMEGFLNDNDGKKSQNVSFSGGLDLLSIANKFESSRNYQLLSVDVGTATGRTISARNNDERIEILFRDLASVYFYMFNMPNMNRWLNKLEQNGVGTRLDPVSAEYTTRYLKANMINNNNVNISIEEFKKQVLGKDNALPKEIKSLFNGSKETITLKDFNNALKNIVSKSEYERLSKIAKGMSELQPELEGVSILTKSQVEDIFRGGLINDPNFLKRFYMNNFGLKFKRKYKFVSQAGLDGMKKDLENYIKSIIAKAQKAGRTEITKEILEAASKHNLKMNALNWGSGFAISALFLSTIIPKTQYWITKMRTGSDAFPGTAQYRKQENKTA